jgi:hypothetical protein
MWGKIFTDEAGVEPNTFDTELQYLAAALQYSQIDPNIALITGTTRQRRKRRTVTNICNYSCTS